MSDSYYEREYQTLPDGSKCFENVSDRDKEQQARLFIEPTWNCRLHHLPKFNAIDWYASRGNALVAHLEIKGRDHASDRFETVFFNLRKWLPLTMARLHLNVPSLFVVQFTDKLLYIDVGLIDTRQIVMGGTKRIVKSGTDIEPVILVPVASMKPVVSER